MNNKDLQELKKFDRRVKYLYERDKGRLLRYDDAYISDKSATVEDLIDKKNLHISLQKALNKLSDTEYQIIQECFFSNERVNFSKLCKKYNITRQVYIRKEKRILSKLKKLVTYYYNKF